MPNFDHDSGDEYNPKLRKDKRLIKRGRNIVIFGEFGVGKSTVAATAPKPKVLDSDFGSASYETRPQYEHVSVTNITKWSQLDKALANFQGVTKHRWDKKFLTIIHDRFEDVQYMALDEMNAKIHQEKSHRDQDSYDKKEWGRMGVRARRYVRDMKALPVHKIYLCGQMTSNETGAAVPALAGGFKGQMPGLMDDVMYMRIGKKGRRYLHLHPTEEFYAKTRAWWFPKEPILVPDPAEDAKFMTRLIERLVAGPIKTTPTPATKTRSK